MKIHYLEMEKPRLGRKPKRLKLDHKAVAKLGSAIYNMEEVRGISIKVGLKNGTSIHYNRHEDEDNIRRRIAKDVEDEDED